MLSPLPVLLTRYAAQSLYAPLRTLEPGGGDADRWCHIFPADHHGLSVRAR
ncbi:integrating conjugative element protein, PFL_4704 family [Escherichia coli]|uniref:Integrating conjugative element protein, PFL_4704 family n=1 Tax=Escherichia coli TaxID=562 RepID=A0A376KM41_ECOLX|nr:integrating conjugative element protein, PFL_4704 family [Escherichia coli]